MAGRREATCWQSERYPAPAQGNAPATAGTLPPDTRAKGYGPRPKTGRSTTYRDRSRVAGMTRRPALAAAAVRAHLALLGPAPADPDDPDPNARRRRELTARLEALDAEAAATGDRLTPDDPPGRP